MSIALFETLMALGVKWGPVAYEKGVELYHKIQDAANGGPVPSKADFLAISDAALLGSADKDEQEARARAAAKAAIGG